MNNWKYNEYIQVGKDYADQKEVDLYESTHSKFRDLINESLELIRLLKLSHKDTLADFGCGTGVFATEAAKICRKVYALDVSEAMLDYSLKKAEMLGLDNIEFCHSGFLDYKIPAESLDFITSTFSFHHLPDYWKSVALERLYNSLVPGGKLYLKDVVLSSVDSVDSIQVFIDRQEKLGGDFLKEDAEQHFREEFSTFDWVLDELFIKSGFNIETKQILDGVIGVYLCSKN